MTTISNTNTEASAVRRKRWVRVDEGFAYCNVRKSKGWVLIRDGKIKAKKMDGLTLVDLDSIDAYHDSLPDI